MNILIWGTGNLAEKLLQNGLKEQNIIGFIETIRTKETYRNKKVFELYEIKFE